MREDMCSSIMTVDQKGTESKPAKKPNKKPFSYTPGDRRFKEPEPLGLEDFSITVKGKKIPLKLRAKIDGHTTQAWLFADNAPYKPYELTYHKEYKAFLRTINVIRKIYGSEKAKEESK